MSSVVLTVFFWKCRKLHCQRSTLGHHHRSGPQSPRICYDKYQQSFQNDGQVGNLTLKPVASYCRAGLDETPVYALTLSEKAVEFYDRPSNLTELMWPMIDRSVLRQNMIQDFRYRSYAIVKNKRFGPHLDWKSLLNRLCYKSKEESPTKLSALPLL